jgi:hypothetical protein
MVDGGCLLVEEFSEWEEFGEGGFHVVQIHNNEETIWLRRATQRSPQASRVTSSTVSPMESSRGSLHSRSK